MKKRFVLIISIVVGMSACNETTEPSAPPVVGEYQGFIINESTGQSQPAYVVVTELDNRTIQLQAVSDGAALFVLQAGQATTNECCVKFNVVPKVDDSNNVYGLPVTPSCSEHLLFTRLSISSKTTLSFRVSVHEITFGFASM